MATSGFSFGNIQSFGSAQPNPSVQAPTSAGSPFRSRGPLLTVQQPTPTSFSPVVKSFVFESTAVPAQGQAKKPAKDLKATQHELFNKEKYSDLTIKCKTREWKCHRAILCPRCPFFEAACGGQFTEASTREVDLSDDDETALGIMLQYLYTYEIFNHGLATATSYQLIIIGDKYELEEIRDVGLQNISNEIADLTSGDGQWAAEWYPQICQLQQKGAESLKGSLANTIAKHAREMIKHDAVRELIATDGVLAVLLVEKLANPASAMFGKPIEARTTDWLGSTVVSGFGGAPASTAATFGSSLSSTTRI